MLCTCFPPAPDASALYLAYNVYTFCPCPSRIYPWGNRRHARALRVHSTCTNHVPTGRDFRLLEFGSLEHVPYHIPYSMVYDCSPNARACSTTATAAVVRLYDCLMLLWYPLYSNDQTIPSLYAATRLWCDQLPRRRSGSKIDVRRLSSRVCALRVR